MVSNQLFGIFSARSCRTKWYCSAAIRPLDGDIVCLNEGCWEKRSAATLLRKMAEMNYFLWKELLQDYKNTCV